jgi:hypothetical protein
MRNRGELSEVVQAGFEPGRIAVARAGKRLLLRTSTDEWLWRMFRETEAPPNERRRKAGQTERLFREGHESRQDA